MREIDLGVLVTIALLFSFGASIGSFLAAAAWRLPRGVSLLRPSQCTHCNAPIPWFGLVPVLGVFLVRGRCHSCKERFSPHYAIFEALIGALTVLTVAQVAGIAVFAQSVLHSLSFFGEPVPVYGQLHYDWLPPLITALWLLYSGAILSLIDIEFRILPDVITIPGAVFGIMLALYDPTRGVSDALLGSLVGAGGLWAIATGYKILRKRDGLGMGDVKYLGLIGAATGWMGVLWCLMIASVLGSIVGISLGIAQRKGLNTIIPFGPFLAIGSWLYAVFPDFFLRLLLE